MHGSLPGTGRTVADDLDDVRRSAEQLLSGVDKPPSALRIRAGDVLVEMEWADGTAALPAADAARAAAAAAVTALAPPGLLPVAAHHAAPHVPTLHAGHPHAGHAAVAANGAVSGPAATAVAADAGAGAAGAVATAAPPGDGHTDICAATVGTFYRSPEPGTAPFVSEGDHVRRGQQVAIIEVMKLMIPVEAERDGHIAAIHVPDGTSVEYGDRLFTLAPATGH
jgi:acetyl-CoA carboxylase biotin carboxyl carrier protein